MDNVAVFFGLLMLFIFIFRLALLLVYFSHISSLTAYWAWTCSAASFVTQTHGFVTERTLTLFFGQQSLFFRWKACKTITRCVNMFVDTDLDPRGLEHCSVLWDGAHQSLGSTLLHCADDLRELCALQPTCGYFSGGIQMPGTDYEELTASLIILFCRTRSS